jgi:hypothetical protein
MIALLNAVVTVEPGTDPRAVTQAMADAVLTRPVPVAAIIRPRFNAAIRVGKDAAIAPG